MTGIYSVDDSPEEKAWRRLWDRRCEVLHSANVTYRYHRKRQRFFDLLDKGTKALTVLLGASLLGEAVKQHLPLVAATISALGLMALVFGYGDRKQSHKECAEAAMQLVAKIEEMPTAGITDNFVALVAADHARQNAKEPPALKTLVILCEREQSTAMGHPHHIPRPNLLKRVFADFIS